MFGYKLGAQTGRKLIRDANKLDSAVKAFHFFFDNFACIMSYKSIEKKSIKMNRKIC